MLGEQERSCACSLPGMWYAPDSLVVLASLIFLAPAEVTLARSTVVPARAARVAACDAPSWSLPDSIRLSDGLQPMVRWALEHSPSFRQQCRALAAAPALRATVRVVYRRPGLTSRALTSFRQQGAGALDADIEIRSAPDLTELLAHEFEHLIEQLDGVDLTALARKGEARRLSDGAFETDRAIAAGHEVAGEVVDNAPDRIRNAGASVWRALRRAVGGRTARKSADD
jgi:hypothetical protein